MNKVPKISIITACFNAERTIEQTMQSVLSQTYDNIEYIIVDGVSIDNTMKIINKYREQIGIIISEPDEGIYDAFNKGMNIATGDYIYYLNADDVFCDNTVVEQIVKQIMLNDFPIAVYGGVIGINMDSGYKFVHNKELNYNDVSKGISVPHHQGIFILRNKLIEMGGFNLKYKISADLLLILNIYKQLPQEFIYIHLNIANFRLGGFSSVLSNRKNAIKEYNDVIEEVFEHQNAVSIKNDDYYKRWLEKSLLGGRNIIDVLKEKSVKNVAIFGGGEISNILACYLINNNLRVLALLDNNAQINGFVMNNITVYSPDWLKINYDQIDTVIFGFEGFHEEAVIDQIESFSLPVNLNYYSWRELVSLI